MRKYIRIWMMLAGAASFTHGQWLHHPAPGTPRAPDGKADLSARAPRASNGKPDLSGIWQPESPTREEALRFFTGGVNNLGEDPPSRYFMNMLYDFKPGDSPLRPSAVPAFEQHRAGLAKDISGTRCLPFGVPLMDLAPFPYKIIQTPGVIMMLYEQGTNFRQIFVDGRKFPEDTQPSWLGYSIGKWDRDSLVVDTIGFNDLSWLDAFGHPHSEAMHVTERFHRRDFGHMELQITVDDPKTYTKPFTIQVNLGLLPDTDLIEHFCAENERDLSHMVGK
jgi:hypothetical protein